MKKKWSVFFRLFTNRGNCHQSPHADRRILSGFCEDFFQSNGEPDPLSATLGTDGTYHLVTATQKNANGYRQAYRMGYIDVQSPEVIHSNRAYSLYNSFNAEYGNGGREEAHYGSQASYMWWSFVGLGRHSYLPTEEYVEMFPWSDRRPVE